MSRINHDRETDHFTYTNSLFDDPREQPMIPQILYMSAIMAKLYLSFAGKQYESIQGRIQRVLNYLYNVEDLAFSPS
jgi:hypothetical protein